MPLSPGTRLGPYEVIDSLGAGGMGEVYRARHTGLKREDALKVLPDTFTSDPERVARFQREAEMLASLNHPRIAAIYGMESSEGVQALVLELVEGPTLADRIAEGAIPLHEALDIAKQIAEALEAAHEQGIIHRDLKPANVKVKAEGTVKVLDFGLAKALEPSASATTSSASKSPTITSPAMTLAGMILGTAAYMSPEQARGKRADRRADVWAFGCVLYEMLTGQRAFPGDDVSDTFVAILSKEPDWDALPTPTPLGIRSLLQRCLRKDPRRRLPDIAAARIEIEDAQNEPETSLSTVTARPFGGRYAGWVVALVLLLTTLAAGVQLLRQPVTESPPVRFDLVPPHVSQLADPQLSPDGRSVAYLAAADGTRRVWVHRFRTATTEPIEGTEGAVRFFWSGDGAFIGFIADGRLRRVPVSGGPPQVITALPPPRPDANANLRSPTAYYGTWNEQGVILLASPSNGPLQMVQAAGGQLVPATELDASREERFHQFPSFLPDGRHYLFYAATTAGQNNASFVGTLGEKERQSLPGISSQVKYSSSGHLLFVRDGALMAQRFDARRLELSGEAIPVADAFTELPTSGMFSASLDGALVFVASSTQTSQFTWFDRTGKQLGTVGPPGIYAQPMLSPNDRFVAFQRGGRETDIWVLDLERGVTSPATSHPGRDTSPVWSPDSKTLAFDSTRANPGSGPLRGIYSRGFGTVGEDRLLIATSARNLSDWSRDGRYIAYEDGTNIWALELPVTPNAVPQRISEESPFPKGNPRISPDGRWIAYESSESREGADVYIQSFPKPGVKLKASRAGGTQPQWSHDSTELFYIATDLRLMSVPIRDRGSELELGVPVTLFQPPSELLPFRGYSVSRDGRFLLSILASQPSAITVILNWASGLQR